MSYDYSQPGNYPPQAYYPQQQSGFAGTILTPGSDGAGARSSNAQFGDTVEDFENEPPLLEGTQKKRKENMYALAGTPQYLKAGRLLLKCLI